jgi:hypothetical protein
MRISPVPPGERSAYMQHNRNRIGDRVQTLPDGLAPHVSKQGKQVRHSAAIGRNQTRRHGSGRDANVPAAGWFTGSKRFSTEEARRARCPRRCLGARGRFELCSVATVFSFVLRAENLRSFRRR